MNTSLHQAGCTLKHNTMDTLEQLRAITYQVKDKYGPAAAEQFYLEYIHPIRLHLKKMKESKTNYTPNFKAKPC